MNFGDIAQEWWDLDGPMRPLHKLNPERIDYIVSQTGDLNNKSVLDIGCGAGITSESLCRLGAHVTAIDVEEKLIEAAKIHAAQNKLEINYHNIELEHVTKMFDVVTLLEVVEHVDDPALLIKQASARLKPDGIIVLSTLNRTIKSLALGKIAAEYILRWVPAGTHDWKMFIKPHELVAMAQKAELKPMDLCGLQYNPLHDTFALAKTDLSINYFLTCQKEST